MRGGWQRQLVELPELPGKKEHRLVHRPRRSTAKIQVCPMQAEISLTLLANFRASVPPGAFDSSVVAPFPTSASPVRLASQARSFESILRGTWLCSRTF